MSIHRFFAPALDPGDDLVDLPRDEAEHLTRVLRLGAGDTVSVFNGRGDEFLGRVVAAARREARVQVLSRQEPAPESTTAITLVQAVLKGDKMDDVVRDAVMLGAVAIQPIVTRRTEVTVAALMRGARVARWQRVALASVKQARRAFLPEILTPLTFETWLDEPAPDLRVMCVEPAIDGAEPLTALRTAPVPSSAALLVGPEGGWEPGECQQAWQRGLRLVSLGGRTLRADAVPIAALSVLQFLWDHSC
ncbi:MAG: 16S rRNA (uracil(1498)-N(3))-methyltransferase [Acidobacteria bacterium]|nr:16S rRNA (uracil(1498)-N(3))-methyltransferase [Acidobacteriota bacterium]